jgi:hypothetical protein
MRVPDPDKAILTWRFMGRGIKVGRKHCDLIGVPYPDKPIPSWRFMGGGIKVGRSIRSSREFRI